MTGPYIGMPVWVFDKSRSVYKKDASGQSVGGPIWREYWVKMEIVGETSRSWLVGPDWCKKDRLEMARKIPKRDWPGPVAISQDEIDRAAYVNDKAISISNLVSRCKDFDILKKVEALVKDVKS